MGKRYQEITPENQEFIKAQKIFFVGTATDTSRVNVSPKGLDALRILNPNRVIWLNVTGSGNETACHVQSHPRMTLMFAAFEGAPKILRLYGTARVIHQHDSDWSQLFSLFDPLPGARQIFDLSVDLVQSSCGFAVPRYDYVQDRDELTTWANKKGPEGIESYWNEKNQRSLDGNPTHILGPNSPDQ